MGVKRRWWWWKLMNATYISVMRKKKKKRRQGLVMLRRLVLFFQSFIQDTSVRDDHDVLLHRLLLRVWRFEDFVDFF